MAGKLKKFLKDTRDAVTIVSAGAVHGRSPGTLTPEHRAAMESEAAWRDLMKRAEARGSEQQREAQANAERAYKNPGWHASKEGQAALEKYKKLMKGGDARERSVRATRIRK